MVHSSVEKAAFCGEALTDIKVKLGAHIFVVLLIVILIFLLCKFIGKRNFFPVRERAPRIAIAQCIMNLLQILTVYVLEIGLEFQDYVTLFDWDRDSPDNIPMARYVFKCMYLTLRLNIYIVFLLR